MEYRKKYIQSLNDKGVVKNGYNNTSGEYARLIYLKYRETIIKTSKKWFVERYRNDEDFRKRVSLRSCLNSFIHSKRTNKNNKTEKYLGCSRDFFKEYLQSRFLPGMTWENYGRNGWHIDHIVPMSKIDFKNEETIYSIMNYKNTQPLWAKDNISKKNKTTLI